MKKIWIGAFGLLAAAALIPAAVLYNGMVDVSADTPHSPVVYELIAAVRERSIARSAGDVVPPTDLSEAARVRRGAGNYGAMCAGCHLSPGVADSEIRKGLYPQPPDLTALREAGEGQDRFAARQFWIIKHGIKATGMAAWSKGGMTDPDIWDLVAFLQALPALSPAQYRQLVTASGGHTHGGEAVGEHGQETADEGDSGHDHGHGDQHH